MSSKSAVIIRCANLCNDQSTVWVFSKCCANISTSIHQTMVKKLFSLLPLSVSKVTQFNILNTCLCI